MPRQQLRNLYHTVLAVIFLCVAARIIIGYLLD